MGLQTTGRNRAPEASAGCQGMIARKHINECIVPHFKYLELFQPTIV